MANQCFKISQAISIIKKLNDIKTLINDVIKERREKIDSLSINDPEKKKITKELDRKITNIKIKYNIIHNKLYDIIDVLSKCECCIKEEECKGESLCLKQNDNDEIWFEMDTLFEKVRLFYEEVETKLVTELNLCLFRLNKIKKISYLVA